MSKQGMVLSSSAQTGAPKSSPFHPLSSGIDVLSTCKLMSNTGQVEVLQMQKRCQTMHRITLDDDNKFLQRASGSSLYSG